jgi:hypothetical protein
MGGCDFVGSAIDVGVGFVTASGDLVVVASPGVVRILDVVSGEYVSSFALDFAVPVTSACLSPDGQHVIIVGWGGEAVVGNTTTGEIVRRLEYGYPIQIRRKHGIGWTTNDQLVFIGAPEGDADHIFTYDIDSGESFVVFQLDGAKGWLAASGTMCGLSASRVLSQAAHNRQYGRSTFGLSPTHMCRYGRLSEWRVV